MKRKIDEDEEEEEKEEEEEEEGEGKRESEIEKSTRIGPRQRTRNIIRKIKRHRPNCKQT